MGHDYNGKHCRLRTFRAQADRKQSGLCACLLNLSQFAIIAGAGPVASTVVGHSKTVTIVTLGWIWSGSGISGYSALGVVIAIGGVVLYSTATTMYKK